MATSARWGPPRRSIQAECGRRGRDAVVDSCIALLGGGAADPALLLALGGPAASKFLDGAQHDDSYWLRVWAMRGLLWEWDERAIAAVRAACGDESWRVREMAAKVVARHLVDDALERVVELRDDPVARVRLAARRAVVRLTAATA
jgi:HEAT repeat protein